MLRKALLFMGFAFAVGTAFAADTNLTIPRDGNRFIPLDYALMGATVTYLNGSTTPVVAMSTGSRHQGWVLGVFLSSGNASSNDTTLIIYDTHTASSLDVPLIEPIGFASSSTYVGFAVPIPFQNGLSMKLSTAGQFADAAVMWVSSNVRPSYALPRDSNGNPGQTYAFGQIQSQLIDATTQAVLVGSSFTTTGQSLVTAADMLLCGYQVSSGAFQTDYLEFRATVTANVTSTRLLPRFTVHEGDGLPVFFNIPVVAQSGLSANLSSSATRTRIFYRKRGK